MAALLTLFAVRVAVRPADDDHQYGHGKAQHLAALGESAFLVLVSLVIGFLAAQRLADGGGHEIEVAWWAIAVLGLVIALDASRMVISHRASRRHGSAALAANALHFGSDLAGSVAVLSGWRSYRRAMSPPTPWPRWWLRCWSSPPQCAWRASRSTC